MADHDSASIVTLHQPRPPRAKTQAERAKADRTRKKANLPAVINGGAPTSAPTPVTLLPREEQSPLQADQTRVGAYPIKAAGILVPQPNR